MALFGLIVDTTTESPVIARLVDELKRRGALAQCEMLFSRSAAAAVSAECDRFAAHVVGTGAALAFFCNAASCGPSLAQLSTAAVAETLWRFIASQPEPLLSSAWYDAFVLAQAVVDESDRNMVYAALLDQVPAGHRANTVAVLGALSVVHRNSTTTHMDAAALADVFAPLFLRPRTPLPYTEKDGPATRAIVAALITEGESLWKSHLSRHRLVSRQKASEPAPLPPFAQQGADSPTIAARLAGASQSTFVKPKRPQSVIRMMALSSSRLFVKPHFLVRRCWCTHEQSIKQTTGSSNNNNSRAKHHPDTTEPSFSSADRIALKRRTDTSNTHAMHSAKQRV